MAKKKQNQGRTGMLATYERLNEENKRFRLAMTKRFGSNYFSNDAWWKWCELWKFRNEIAQMRSHGIYRSQFLANRPMTRNFVLQRQIALNVVLTRNEYQMAYGLTNEVMDWNDLGVRYKDHPANHDYIIKRRSLLMKKLNDLFSNAKQRIE